ncbi:MAG: argininosuccinate lyase, partial [Oscillospiraceae bacterium]|nr:argininosuccinate lyase [Oscillospiraceae bacterium]
MMLWKGRFQKPPDAAANDFNVSIAIDACMAAEDIAGSLAHAAMLTKQGILSSADGELIRAGLQGIAADLETGTLVIDPQPEDIHTFVETELTARIGDAGKKLHTGRSRNDQVALDIRLYLKKECAGLQVQLAELLEVLCDLAERHADTLMPGYTHLQRAQPVTFGHHLMAYAAMFLRDKGRLADAARRMDVSPLGSGALAGTTYPLDREYTAQLLNMGGVSFNSMDGVSDRDFCVELAAALALIMVHLSRFCEEIVLWCSWEFKFIELDDAFATGSSIMPQKKNPDIAELTRGKSGRVFGDLMALLTMLKGLPLAYNKDMQEDKDAVFDACDTVRACLTAFTPMIRTMTVLPDNMRAAAAKGFINA